MATKKPNILILWGDDIGWWNISFNSRGQMGYRTPNIDRVANEGVAFTDYYGQQSCTAGRAAFITGQNPIRTGLTKVGMPGADVGLSAEDPTIAELLKPLGYATGQFGKNHLGDKDEFLPTMHGFDEFFGNLYHLNAEEEPEDCRTIRRIRSSRSGSGPRGVLHCWADGKGGQKIEDTGPLTKKRMETIDEEITGHALRFIEDTHKADQPFFLWYNTTAMHFRTHCAEKHKGKSGQGEYNDVMVAHDENIGRMLDKLDELGIADDTIVMYSTDNGPHYNSWPDAGITPFRVREEHQLGRRLARSGIRSLARQSSKPARCSTVSSATRTGCRRFWPPPASPDINDQLHNGHKAGDKTFKVHIDGYNLLPYLTGEVKESPTPVFLLRQRRRRHSGDSLQRLESCAHGAAREAVGMLVRAVREATSSENVQPSPRSVRASR